MQDYFTPCMAAEYFEEALRWAKEKGMLSVYNCLLENKNQIS